MSKRFPYVGEGFTPEEFAGYVRRYEFGSIPPNFVVLHHTGVPDASWADARYRLWDAHEQGLSIDSIYRKRKVQLGNIKTYYENVLGWRRGPHLFVDDRWVWVMTPMFYQGIHAANGNGNVSRGGRDYSIGVEVVGCYHTTTWPPAIEHNVASAVWVLHQKLQTFELKHTVGPGGISSHRDYNKPSCPGDAITTAYYIGAIRSHAEAQRRPDVPVASHTEVLFDPPKRYRMAATTPILQAPMPNSEISIRKQEGDLVVVGALVNKGGGDYFWLQNGSGFIAVDNVEPLAGANVDETLPILGAYPLDPHQLVRYLVQHEDGEYTHQDIAEVIVPALYRWAERTGVNPLVMAGQLAHETDCLSSFWSQRSDRGGNPLRNPAGIGVSSATSRRKPHAKNWFYDGKMWRKGLGFAAWAKPEVPGETALAAQAWRLHLYGGGKEHAEAQRWVKRPLPRSYYGCAPTVAQLSGTWMTDPNGHKAIVRRMREILEA